MIYTSSSEATTKDAKIALLFADSVNKLHKAQSNPNISEEDLELLNNQAYYASLRYDSTPEGLERLTEEIKVATFEKAKHILEIEKTTNAATIPIPLDAWRPLEARFNEAELFRQWQTTLVQAIKEVEQDAGPIEARAELAGLYMKYLEGSSQLEHNISTLEQELTEDAQEVIETVNPSSGELITNDDITFINEQYASLYKKNYELSYIILRVSDLQDLMDALTAKING